MQRANAADWVDKRGPGRPKKETLYNTKNGIQGFAPTGTSVKAALRRLRTQRPDLHARELHGEMTANAAMAAAMI